MRKLGILGAATALLAMATPMAPGHAAAATTTLYFHSANPVGNVDHQRANFFGGDGTYMDANAPTKSQPSVGVTALAGLYPNGSIYGPAWRADASGTITGDATVTFWASGAATAFRVSLFVDENRSNAAYAPFASQRIAVGPAVASPTKYTATFTGLNQAVNSEVIVQITPVVTGVANVGDVNVFYDSVDYPSSLSIAIEPPPPGDPTPLSAYELYPAPDSYSGAHGPNELSIGVNPKTNTAMILMSLTTASVTWDDTVSPPKANWKDVSYVTTGTTTMDPYLFTDTVTGRTYVQQLVGEASLAAYTDDDGKTWTTTQPPSTAPSFDHESMATGPYPAGYEVAGNPYGRAAWYCSQGLVMGQCIRSDDGGDTWTLPMEYSIFSSCLPSHGRIVVDDLGSLYLPVGGCGDDGQGLFVTRTAGQSWDQVIVPGMVESASDPVINFDSAGKLYYTAASGGTVKVATSTDRGQTFTQPVDVGALVGVKQAELPMAVAGDDGRIAVSFYGSKTPGDIGSPDYTGEWHVYVATSIDGGATWTVEDITPSDPAQRGMICMSGTTCDSGRNLLDFQAMTIDNDGRVLVAFADGCTTDACKAAVGKTNADAGSTDSLATIARQMSGPRLRVTTG